MRLASWYLRFFRNDLSRSRYKDHLRQLLNRKAPQPDPIPENLRLNFTVSGTEIEGGLYYTLEPKSGKNCRSVIYNHGGAYTKPLIKEHWSIIARLSRSMNAVMYVPIYPLAPEHTHVQAYEFLDRAYEHIQQDALSRCGGEIWFAGDSAGGGIALTMAMRSSLGQQNVKPAGLVLFSPWLDVTMDNPSARKAEIHDPILSVDALIELGRWWTGDTADDIRLRQVHTELPELPPVYMFQGTADILWPDARILSGKIKAQGCEIHYFEYSGAFHVFVAADFLPESRDVFTKLAKLIQ